MIVLTFATPSITALLTELSFQSGTMKQITPIRIKFFFSLVLIVAFGSSSFGDIVELTPFQNEAPSGTFLQAGDTFTFNLDGVDPDDVQLVANFFSIDAGVDIQVNGTSLFPQYADISQFSDQLVFLNTGVERLGPTETREGGDFGNIESPFTANNNNTDDMQFSRLTVTADSAGTFFGGTVNPDTTDISVYDPNFVPVDFNSLLLADSQNTIQFFALNDDGPIGVDGNFAITDATATAIPEPNTTIILMLASVALLSTRRRRP